MKKMLLLFSLFVVLLFVVSCAPGEKTLAGQAVSTSSSYLMKCDYFALPDAGGKIHLYRYKGTGKPNVNQLVTVYIDHISGYSNFKAIYDSGYTNAYVTYEMAYALNSGKTYPSSTNTFPFGFVVGNYTEEGEKTLKSYYLWYRPSVSNKPESDVPLRISSDPEGKEKL